MLENPAMEQDEFQRMTLLSNAYIIQSFEEQGAQIATNKEDIEEMKFPVRVLVVLWSALLPLVVYLLFALLTGQAELIVL